MQTHPMRAGWARRIGVLLAVLVPFVAACSSSSSPHHQASSSSSSVPLSTALVEALSTQWVAQADPAAGITFKLPGAATRRDHTESGIVQRVYTFPFSDQAAVSVGVADLPTADRVRPFVENYASTLEQEFKSGGVTDFSITEQHVSAYLGHPAWDMRIVYMPIAGEHISPAWFIRLVVDGLHVVVLQTVASMPSVSETFVDTCRTLQERLDQTLKFS